MLPSIRDKGTVSTLRSSISMNPMARARPSSVKSAVIWGNRNVSLQNYCRSHRYHTITFVNYPLFRARLLASPTQIVVTIFLVVLTVPFAILQRISGAPMRSI